MPAVFIAFSLSVNAQDNEDLFEIHGFIMLDAGYNFTSIDPLWFDVMRPTKLPSTPGEFGPDGSFYSSVRQTRFAFRSATTTRLGELKTRFESDLFGFGADAGQTTFHLIHAFAELGRFGAGQTASAFMDTDIVPLTLDYWGPNSRIFNFNIQVRYTPLLTDRHRIMVALDRPKGSADGGDYTHYIELENVQPRFLLPNLAAHYRRTFKDGHVQGGVLLKYLEWKDLNETTPYDLSGWDIGWGFSLSSRFQILKIMAIKAQAFYGEGIQNYVADAPTDVGLQSNPGSPTKPFIGKALPVAGAYLFTEWKWNSSLESTIGYSWEDIRNSDLQRPDAFQRGLYGLINLRYQPAPQVMAGIEYQHGKRDTNSDGFTAIGSKIQVSVRVNFSSGDLIN
jgi:hypothetical protein